MNAIITPSAVHGTVAAPPSKSYTHRAILLATLAHGTSHLYNLLLSADTRATIDACKQLGAQITLDGTTATIVGTGGVLQIAPHTTLQCGLSGTTLRLMTAVAALGNHDIVLSGLPRLGERPLTDLTDALARLGVTIAYLKKGATLPIRINGANRKSVPITISAQQSSQFVSALLLIAPLFPRGLRIRVTQAKSAPYIDMTIAAMHVFGISVKKEGMDYIVDPSTYTGVSYTIEGDYSSASYWLAAAAITQSAVTVTDLTFPSIQADAACVSFLQTFGCQVKTHSDRITVLGKPLRVHPAQGRGGSVFDMGNMPDIVPTVAAVAAYAAGTTKITNIGHLKDKESDRIESVRQMLSSFGRTVTAGSDSLEIHGGGLTGAVIETANDHRIAMSAAVAALGAKGKTTIMNAAVVEKSYPDFWQTLQAIGGMVTYTQ